MSATTAAALARPGRLGLRALRLPAFPRPVLPLFALPLLAACGTAQAPAEPQVQKAWVRLPAVPGRPAAGYLTLVGGTRDATLVAVTTPAAARTELHETMKMDAPGAPDHADHADHEGMAGMSGATTMRPVKALPLPAGQTVKLAPGGRHLMLFDVDAKVTPGGTVPLRLEFADGRKLETEAKAVAAGDAGVE
nr:copper chaperone PCu(A)C [uncultured Sphingomonas sp.]